MITYKTKPTNKVIEDGKVKIKLQLIMIQVKKMKLASSDKILLNLIIKLKQIIKTKQQLGQL